MASKCKFLLSLLQSYFSPAAFCTWGKIWNLQCDNILLDIIKIFHKCAIDEDIASIIFTSELYKKNIYPYIESICKRDPSLILSDKNPFNISANQNIQNISENDSPQNRSNIQTKNSELKANLDIIEANREFIFFVCHLMGKINFRKLLG